MAKGKRYKVNYENQAFPKIVLCNPSSWEAQTFSEAKNELIVYVRYSKEHWDLVYRQAKNMKQKDVNPPS